MHSGSVVPAPAQYQSAIGTDGQSADIGLVRGLGGTDGGGNVGGYDSVV